MAGDRAGGPCFGHAGEHDEERRRTSFLSRPPGAGTSHRTRWSAALAAGLVLGIVLEREVLAPQSPVRSAAKQVTGATSRVVAAVQESATAPQGEAATVPSAPLQTGPRSRRRCHQRARESRAGTSHPGGALVGQRTCRHTRRNELRFRRPAALSPRCARRRSCRRKHCSPRIARPTATPPTGVHAAGGSLGPRRPHEHAVAARFTRSERDPQMRALFTDLELVLAQIVQLSGAPLAGGRARADRTFDARPRSAPSAPLRGARRRRHRMIVPTFVQPESTHS